MLYKTRFSNFFFVVGRRLSRDDFARFVKFLIDALKADKSGKYDALIAILEPKYAAFLSTLIARKSGSGEAMTMTYAEVVNECLKFVKDIMRKKVIPEHDKDSPMYKQFLPNGISEYYNANQASFVVLFSRFIEACVANETLISTANKDAAIALNAKLGTKGLEKNQSNKNKQDNIASLDEDEEEIAIIMFKIYGFLIFTFHENPERAYDFFDFSAIKNIQADEDEELKAMPDPKVNA